MRGWCRWMNWIAWSASSSPPLAIRSSSTHRSSRPIWTVSSSMCFVRTVRTVISGCVLWRVIAMVVLVMVTIVVVLIIVLVMLTTMLAMVTTLWAMATATPASRFSTSSRPCRHVRSLSTARIRRWLPFRWNGICIALFVGHMWSMGVECIHHKRNTIIMTTISSSWQQSHHHDNNLIIITTISSS